jgi:hypothetical protein
MKKGKTNQRLRMDWQRNELIRNLEAIFKEGSKLYPLMDEKEVCDKIRTLPLEKAPKNKAELLMVMAANHAKNEKWANENPEPVTPVEDGETETALTSDLGEPVAQTKSGIFLTSAGLVTPHNTAPAGALSSPSIPISKPSLLDADGNSLQKAPGSDSGTPA